MTREDLIKLIIRTGGDTLMAQRMREAAVKVACGVA